ncbi:glycosyltransferase [Sulfurimonas aquatica]|uniref:Glycosyltransferase n=1 Tax=Sulfurimonas aquatica TaxID=2672570 RepID=A0A975AYL3_9BACT|nr:glycosyltransferase family 2 protein [Sulfurimonas aquatica]QSZ40918.1 glycosyltransferase [Sulfurimonas aquatica]
MKISASIVIYNEKKEILKNVIESFLQISLEKELIIIDNSDKANLKEFVLSFEGVKYIHTQQNIGFGAGHNLAFKNITEKSHIHLIINPDVYFESNKIKKMILWMSDNKDISLSVPKVLYPNGDDQTIVRNIPTFLSLFIRKFNFLGFFNQLVIKDEYKNNSFIKTTEIPFAHGCFFVFNSSVFETINGFDERFFLYMEDVDIFIRAKEFGKTVINPHYKIYHEHRKGSSKSFKLLLWHIVSAIKFFLKYRNSDILKYNSIHEQDSK